MLVKKSISTFIILVLLSVSVQAQEFNPKELPVRGLCIAAPDPSGLKPFLNFIEKELVPRRVNTLILRVDYKYQYKSRPELASKDGLSNKEIKSIVEVCKKYNINLIPQVNLLGHQSWHSTPSKLLEVYPEFDETPHVKLPEEYVWPNEDGLYCKSYCPLHPDVHNVVFDIVDEIMDVFEAKSFHAGMDEIFYLADPKCPRCSGKDPAELFAGEVTKVRNHLAEKGRDLWIWGDRLIDGKTTGMGIWEASFNNTYRAIDMIPKDVFICDWHYERPDQTPVYFAMKGFNVATCPWRNPKVGVLQVADMVKFRSSAKEPMNQRYQGIIQTVWTSSENFIESFYHGKLDERGFSDAQCFKEVFGAINEK
ncbi:MAG: family 20 glycosylhydrolase [Cyclobacteriaceae bacterium]|nr:family 20 glycosylhydrolase [Cyclobacteriaceae bacterium]